MANAISDDSGEEFSIEEVKDLDEVGAKCIELYQNQLALADRIWAYFSQYSALVVILGCLVVVYRETDVVKDLPKWVLLVPVAVYFVFALGNHRALDLTLRELQIVRGIAVTRTRYEFKGTAPGTMLRYHMLLIVIVVAMYLAACFLRF